MNRARITLLGSQEQALLEFLESDPRGHERAAVVLFRRLHNRVDGLEDSDRFIAIEVIPFDNMWVTSSSPSHVRFDLKYLREIFRRCQEEHLVFGFIHNHPTGYPAFSDTDEENERTLLRALVNRNGQDIHLIAMLRTNGSWLARSRNGTQPDVVTPARHVTIIGDRLQIHAYESSKLSEDSIHSRQAAAFGQPFVDILHSLRVGVVGAGGTGSPTVTLLARAGVGEVIIFDQDHLEKSNLNRVRGAGMHDVGKNKARILHDYIQSLGLPVKTAIFESLIDLDPAAVDALSSCDVIYGCTDDQIGRELLTAAPYVYAQAYVDIGLGGKVIEGKDGVAQLRYHYGRVSTILPEFGECLFCQDVIRPEWIRHQYALRDNPKMTAQEAADRYLVGGGEQAPGVGPFTSATADYGVASLFDLIRPFRKFGPEVRRDMYVVDFVLMTIRSQSPKNNLNCPYCKKNEYLLAKEKYRLNRTSLGEANVAT